MATEKASALLSTEQIAAMRVQFPKAKRESNPWSKSAWLEGMCAALLAHVEAQQQELASFKVVAGAAGQVMNGLQDALAQAEAALRESISQAYISGVKRDELSATVAEQAAIIARLRDGLERYGIHEPHCLAVTSPPRSCNCGFATVRDEKEPK